MDKIVIKRKATGEIVHEYPAGEYVIGRSLAKVRKRKSGIITPEQFDALCSAALNGTRGGKRIEGARRVMTQGVSCTDAANFVGLTPSSVTQLVIQLEKHIVKANKAHVEKYMSEPVEPTVATKPAAAFEEYDDSAEYEEIPASEPRAVPMTPKPTEPPKMPYQEFQGYLDALPQSMKLRSANNGARMVLTQNTPISHVHKSYPGADLYLTQTLVDKIRQMKAEKDAADLINDLE